MKYLIRILAPIIFIISYFVKKDNSIWIYGSWYGKLYKDNSKALFESANILLPDINHVWIYKEKSLAYEIPPEFKSIYAYSMSGLITQLKAKVFISTLNTSDFIPFFVTPRNIVVQLWHGSPLKNIGIDSRKTIVRKMLDRLRFMTLDKYTYCLSPAAIFDDKFASAFLLKKENILRSAYPRNMSLFISDQRKKQIRDSLNISEDTVLVLYLPTHRKEGNDSSVYTKSLELSKYDNVLHHHNIQFIIKPHFYDIDNFRLFKDSSSIKVLFDLDIDLYELLASSDALVTDYSSVFFDYELLRKPIFIFPFDLDEYIASDRGMYFDPHFIFNNLNHTLVVNSLDELVESCIALNNFDSSAFKDNKGLFNEIIDINPEVILHKIKHLLN